MSGEYIFSVDVSRVKDGELRVIPSSDSARKVFHNNCKAVPAALQLAEQTRDKGLSRAIRKAVGKNAIVRHLVHSGGS